MEDLRELATLLARRNDIEAAISALIRRPATAGHIGEFIAARIFNIRLEPSAAHKASDGYFIEGPLAGRCVDVKFYGRQEGLLAIQQRAQPDYFLVLTGPEVAPSSSRGGVRPALIEHVYLFSGQELGDSIRRRGVQFGVAASIPKAEWHAAEIFPSQTNRALALTAEQKDLLSLFSGKAGV